MANEFAISHANTLIGLASVEALELLDELFGQIVVSEAVRDEVLAGGDRRGARELSGPIGSGTIKVLPVKLIATLAASLDVGEASTLTLGIEHAGLSLVRMDEMIGRSYARAHGLNVTGLVGVLLAAKREGLVSSVGPFLERLKNCNFRLSDELVRSVIEEAGES